MPLAGAATTVARARAGDLDAFEELMRANERQVLGVAFRMLGRIEDAQDVAQEAFLRLYRNLKRVEDEVEVRRWLYRVTVNLCLDARRRRRPSVELTETNLAAGSADPELRYLHVERAEAVARGLETLAGRERAALVLREVEGLSTREVAELMGASEVTVRAHICTARMKLKKFTDRYFRKKVL